MFRNDRRKGILLAFIATFALANVYIFSKAALNAVHLFQFGVYWFGFALILNFIFIRIAKKKINLNLIKKKEWRAIFFNSFFEVLGTLLFFYSIQLIDNPAVVSFIVNLGPVFTMIFGFFLLKERFKLVEYVGIFITLIGVLIINYNTNTAFADIFSKGTIIVVLSTLFFSIAVVIAKNNIQKIEPIILTSFRALSLFIISFILVIKEGIGFNIDLKSILYIAGGAFMGPFLAILTSYYSLKYIEVSISNIIISTKSVLVIIGAYFFFNVIMSGNELIGGALTVVGIIVISISKRISKLSILRKRR